MVILHTNHGDITLELDAENAPETVANFLAVRPRRPLRQHDLPPRDRRLHDPGRRHGAGHEAEAHARADRQRSRPTASRTRTTRSRWRARPSPHSATAQFFINVADNDFLDYKAPSPQGWGYCVFGKVVAGQDVVDKIKGVPTGNSGFHQNVPREDVVIERAEETA